MMTDEVAMVMIDVVGMEEIAMMTDVEGVAMMTDVEEVAMMTEKEMVNFQNLSYRKKNKTLCSVVSEN